MGFEEARERGREGEEEGEVSRRPGFRLVQKRRPLSARSFLVLRITQRPRTRGIKDHTASARVRLTEHSQRSVVRSNQLVLALTPATHPPDPMSQHAAKTSTQRAALADICRGRARRPPALLRPRFVRRGVDAADVADGGGDAPSPSSRRPPAATTVVFDEVLFDTGDEDGDGQSVPMWVARPVELAIKTAPTAAVVLWLHGKGERRGAYLAAAQRLAARGCLFAVPEMPYHGARRRRRRDSGVAEVGAAEQITAEEDDAAAFDAAVARAVREGRNGPLILDWAWDALCALDALEALYGGGGGAGSSVLLAGSSMGGSAALLLAAALSSGSSGGPSWRVAACVPVIALQYWRWGFENGEAWQGRAESLGPALQAAIEVAEEQGDREAPSLSPREAWRRALQRLVPGILTDYDAPRVLAALRAAGIPLLACSSASDPRCPIGGVRAAWREAEEEDKEASSLSPLPPKHELFVDDSARGHKFTGAMMLRVEDWLLGGEKQEELGLFG